MPGKPVFTAAEKDSASVDAPGYGVIERIGLTMTKMRVMTGRRVIVRRALANVSPDLELSAVDVLEIIRRIGPDQEATIGVISDGLRIDPSRGSRIVADMVANGILERRASQSDGRRSIVVITELGRRIMAEIHSVKHAVVSDIIRDWNDADIEVFAELYERFVDQLAERLAPGCNLTGRD